MPGTRGDVEKGVPRLTRWEKVGAWLHIWTPPREVEVPPVPKRKLALAAVALLVVAGGVTAWLVPRIESGKAERSRAESRRLAAVEAKERRRVAREQRLHTASSGEHRGGHLSKSTERRLRKAVVADLERSITADARARVRRHQLQGPIRATVCDPYPASVGNVGPETTLRGTLGRYDCTAVEDYVPDGRAGRGALGYPFWAKVNFRGLDYAWCKVNPRPGERTVGSALATVPLPKGCDLGY